MISAKTRQSKLQLLKLDAASLAWQSAFRLHKHHHNTTITPPKNYEKSLTGEILPVPIATSNLFGRWDVSSVPVTRMVSHSVAIPLRYVVLICSHLLSQNNPANRAACTGLKLIILRFFKDV